MVRLAYFVRPWFDGGVQSRMRMRGVGGSLQGDCMGAGGSMDILGKCGHSLGMHEMRSGVQRTPLMHH